MKNPISLNDATKSEAAAWLARLRADDRLAADEEAFRNWLAASPENVNAFEAVSTVWDIAGGVTRDLRGREPRRAALRQRREVLAGVGVAIAAAGTFSFWQRAEATVYETAVGEQKHVVLKDSSRVFLDTDTRIVVKFSEKTRLVDLTRGRVNFHIAADGNRPFIVSSADQTIIASESDFDVRRDGQTVSVLLIEGKAAVETSKKSASMLGSGQRLVASSEHTSLDRPNLVPLLAWQKGQTILENAKLTDAVAEMNRYSEVKLEIGDRAVSALRVSGVYKVGDNLAFARSVAKLLPVKVQQTGGRVLLVIDASRMRQG